MLSRSLTQKVLFLSASKSRVHTLEENIRREIDREMREKARREKEIFVNNFVRIRGNLLIDGDFEQTVIPIFFREEKKYY